jgi:predicted TIM-barrel fold metal-dependent hydrolase
MAVYELAARKSAPLFFCQSTHFQTQGRMEYARPSLLDEIAREYPNLTIVISSLGHPWIEEGIALMGKHPHVYGDIAGLIRRPWQAYNALVLAHQYHVMDKVLFGSDFPYCTAAKAIEGVYRLHEVTQGTNLPSVPRETLRSMVERDALTALAIARPGEASRLQKPRQYHEEEVM